VELRELEYHPRQWLAAQVCNSTMAGSCSRLQLVAPCRLTDPTAQCATVRRVESTCSARVTERWNDAGRHPVGTPSDSRRLPQAEGSQVPGHDLISDKDDPLTRARLWSRGNSAYGGGDGDFVEDNSIGVQVDSMKAVGPQRTQMLLLNQADWMKPINPYVPPMDLYIYWGESSARGTLASGFQGVSSRVTLASREWLLTLACAVQNPGSS